MPSSVMVELDMPTPLLPPLPRLGCKTTAARTASCHSRRCSRTLVFYGVFQLRDIMIQTTHAKDVRKRRDFGTHHTKLDAANRRKSTSIQSATHAPSAKPMSDCRTAAREVCDYCGWHGRSMVNCQKFARGSAEAKRSTHQGGVPNGEEGIGKRQGRTGSNAPVSYTAAAAACTPPKPGYANILPPRECSQKLLRRTPPSCVHHRWARRPSEP